MHSPESVPSVPFQSGGRLPPKLNQMKKILRSTVIAAASVASLLSVTHGKPEGSRQKKQRITTQPRRTVHTPPAEDPVIAPADLVPPRISAPTLITENAAPETPVATVDRYPWKRDIVTTTFWIGEKPTRGNPVPNSNSAWDKDWAKHYGGTDTPERKERTRDFRPAAFVPGQNPFYVALPYNDLQMNGHKPEAEKLIPWFKSEYRGPGQSVCKGRWIAIRHKGRIAYAQWEDCGPFRTDAGSYVFGNDRPRKNLNRGAGLDVSPAVRDFLGMDGTDVSDWKFVDFDEVPHGPWAAYGENNMFVLMRRLHQRCLAAIVASARAPR